MDNKNQRWLLFNKMSTVMLLSWLAVACGYIYFFYQLYKESESAITNWAISDWLINYEDGGFKRRGLSGSILFLIQDYTSMALPTIVMILQISFYCLFLFLVVKWVIKNKVDLFFTCLLFSPFVLFFPICTPLSAGRKEILLMVLFYWYAFSSNRKLYDWLTLFLYILIIFLHELALFYLPFLLWIKYIKNNATHDWLYSAVLVLVSALSVGVILIYGGHINQGQSVAILLERGVKLSPGNIFSLEFAYDFDHVLRHKLSFSIHLLELFLVMSQILFYVYYFQQKYFKEFLVGTIICFVWTLPLYYLAIDWFRWIYIFSCLLVLIILMNFQYSKKMEIVVTKKNFWLLLLTPFTLILFYFHMNHDKILELIGF